MLSTILFPLTLFPLSVPSSSLLPLDPIPHPPPCNSPLPCCEYQGVMKDKEIKAKLTNKI